MVLHLLLFLLHHMANILHVQLNHHQKNEKKKPQNADVTGIKADYKLDSYINKNKQIELAFLQ